MIKCNEKYGCLTVLDEGEEYFHTELYKDLQEKARLLQDMIKPYKDELKEIKEKYPEQFEAYVNHNYSACEPGFIPRMRRIQWATVSEAKELKTVSNKLKKHYKCQCKCGMLHFYNEETIESKPRFCYYPVPISTRNTYSIKAQNATYRKQQKYENQENVVLKDKEECLPADDYCGKYNDYKTKQLLDKEKKFQGIIADLPRVYAENYDEDFIGLQYESLFVESCVNDHLESQPRYHFTQRHNKIWSAITVYKQYKCKCKCCGKEQLVTCDKFGIYPPTEYGYHAYFGYWSDIFCDCHEISSFQWIVCKLLIENKINYEVEYSFPDLYGAAGKNLLRFDFAIKDDEGNLKTLIECQGEQHYMPVTEFGGKAGFERQKKNDELKREYVNARDIPYLEISYKAKTYESIKELLILNNIIMEKE